MFLLTKMIKGQSDICSITGPTLMYLLINLLSKGPISRIFLFHKMNFHLIITLKIDF